MTASERSESHKEAMASRPDVAAFLKVSPQTLAIWAMKGEGPKYRRVGRHCRYEWVDVYAWLDSRAEFGGTV